MKEKIIERLSNNKEIYRLLKSFEEEFLRVYYKSNTNEKAILMNFRDSAFRKWMFSPIIEETYITPNHIINNLAQIEVKGNYSIMPHIKISEVDKRQLVFETNWIYYSNDNSPVIEDLHKLMEFCNPTLIRREDNRYVVDNGEELIEKLNFRSGYYIEFLIGLAIKMEMLKEMRSIGCQCYEKAEGYLKYINLSDADKVKHIITNAMEVSEDGMKEAFKYTDEGLVYSYLDNNIATDEYEWLVEKVKVKYEGLTEVTEELGEFGELINKTDMALFMAIMDVGIGIDMNFTSIFAYYLGIINPIYDQYFILDGFVSRVAETTDVMEVLSILFSLEGAHDLSLLGEELISGYKKNKLKEKQFNPIKQEQIQDIVERYLENKDIIVQEYLEMINSLGNMKDIFSEILNSQDGLEIDDYNQYFSHLPKDIAEHILEFYDYLFMERNLKESSCEKSCENIELFLWNCLNIETVDNIAKIVDSTVDYYLGDWFIKKVATSKNSINEQIASLKQYVKFLEKKSIIDKSNAKEIAKILKDKDKYIELFEKYIEEDDMDEDYFEDDLFF